MSEKEALLGFVKTKDLRLEYDKRDKERKIIEDKLKPILGTIVFKNETLRDELMKQVLGGKNKDNKKRLKKCYREYKNIGTAKDNVSPVPYVRYISDRRLKKLSPDEQLQYRRRRAEYLACSDIRKGKLSMEIEAILGNEAIDSCMICALEKEITNARDKRVLVSYYRLLNEQRSNKPYTRLGTLLRDLRINRKQSLEDMAALLCIRPSCLIALSRGKRPLTKYQYDCLVDYYKPNREDMKVLQEAIGTKRVAV